MNLCICGNSGIKRCTKCKSKFYCSKDCQRIDWSSHKHGCSISDEKVDQTYSFSYKDIKIVLTQIKVHWNNMIDTYNSIPSHVKGSTEKQITKETMDLAVDNISKIWDSIQYNTDFSYKLSKSLEKSLSTICWQEELANSRSLETYIGLLNTYECMQLERTPNLLNRVIDSVVS